uniref:Uncharacterized protein n=1 Tax=Brassica oleracea var. oleracea TaxID=109376 RepID=A0A0D3AVZ7_BRAOL
MATEMTIMEAHLTLCEVLSIGIVHRLEQLGQGSLSTIQVSGKQEPQTSRECFHGVSWRDRERENDDLVNHIGGVFRYFIVDVVDPGSTPDVAVQPVSLKFSTGARICYCVRRTSGTHKRRWWHAASTRNRGFRAVYDLQSQGHSGTQGVSHWFWMGLSEDSVRDFTVFLGYLYMMVFLVSLKGVAEGLKGIDSY